MSTDVPPPAPGRPSTGDQFFDSIRRTGIVRADDRWIGGVAAGLSQRVGVDPLVGRAVLVLAVFLGGIGLVAYGIGWAFLPEQRDGRIHLQELFRGNFDAAVAGAIVVTLAGLSGSGAWGSPWWSWWGSGAWSGLLGLGVVALIVAIVVSAVRSSSSAGPAPYGAPYGAPSAPGAPVPPPPGAPVPPPSGPLGTTPPDAVPTTTAADAAHDPGERMSTAPSGTAPSGTAPSGTGASPATAYGTSPATAYGPSPATAYGDRPPAPAGAGGGYGNHGGYGGYGGHGGYQPGRPQPVPPPPAPPRPVVRGAGATATGVVLGLGLLTLAILMLAQRYEAWDGPVLLTAGAITVVLAGLGIVVAGIRGRSSGGLGAIAVLAILVLLPAAAVERTTWTWNGTTAGVGELRHTPTSVAEAERGYTVGAGEARVDLTELPLGSADEAVVVPVSVGAGEAVITMPEDEAYTATIRVYAGEVRWLGDRVRSGVGNHLTELESEAVRDGAEPVLHLDVTVAAGQVTVVESRP